MKEKIKRYKTQLQEYSLKLFSYKGRNVWDTNHSVSQFLQRLPEYKIEDWEKVCKNGIDTILDAFKDSTAKFIIISKSKNIAIQLHWRRDKKNDDGKNHGFTATTLDYKTQQKVKQNDTKIFVEEIKKHKLEHCFESSDYKEMIKEIGYMEVKLIKNCSDYKIYIKEGRIYRNFKIIKVK
jgi:hypothetical protein